MGAEPDTQRQLMGVSQKTSKSKMVANAYIVKTQY